MRNLNAQTLAQLEGSELRAFFLLDLTIDGTDFFYTDADVDIVPDAKYVPIGFLIGDINYSTINVVDQVNITIDGVNRVLLPLFVGGTPQGEAVRVRIVVVDSTGAIIGAPLTIFDGVIDSWSGDERAISITVTNIFIRWAQRTLSKHPSKCRWQVFKGIECTYSDAESTCNRSFDRCVELGNTDNFGGFRFLPSIMEAEIWWGKLRPQENATATLNRVINLPDVFPDIGGDTNGVDGTGLGFGGDDASGGMGSEGQGQ